MVTTLGKSKIFSRAEMRLNIEAQAYAHRVAKKNARFNRASATNKRIAIAQDVLKWIWDGKIIPYAGIYLSRFEALTKADMAKAETRVDGGKCRACALGALFACHVERVGGVDNFWRGFGDERMREKLSPYFDKYQLLLIECAFEKNAGFMYVEPDDRDLRGAELMEAAKRAEAFGRTFPNEHSRMRGIMENIIANKGTFVP